MSDTFFGVDAAAGLKMLGGNTKIYARLLNTYASGDLYESFVAAVNSGDLNAAQVAAHTLKGAAGNLHLKAMYEMIRDIEASIKDTQQMPTGAELEALSLAQLETMASIARIGEDPAVLDTFK